MPDLFSFLQNESPETIHLLLQEEAPLFAGVTLGQLPPQLAAKTLANMSADRQRDVVEKMGKSRAAPDHVLEAVAAKLQIALRALPAKTALAKGSAAWKPRHMEGVQPMNLPSSHSDPKREAAMRRVLKQTRHKKTGTSPTTPSKGKKVDGLALAAEILRFAPGDVRHNISDHEPRLYERLRKRMFTFDDLGLSDQTALARVFCDVEDQTAALALRFAAPALSTRVLNALPPRRAALLKDEMETSARGRVHMQNIETAQQTVLDHAIALQAAGEILIDPNDPDLM